MLYYFLLKNARLGSKFTSTYLVLVKSISKVPSHQILWSPAQIILPSCNVELIILINRCSSSRKITGGLKNVVRISPKLCWRKWISPQVIDQKSRTYNYYYYKKLLPLPPPFSQKRLLHEKSMTFTFMFLKSVYSHIFLQPLEHFS